MSIVLEDVAVKEAVAAPDFVHGPKGQEIEEAPEPVAETVAAAAPDGAFSSSRDCTHDTST